MIIYIIFMHSSLCALNYSSNMWLSHSTTLISNLPNNREHTHPYINVKCNSTVLRAASLVRYFEDSMWQDSLLNTSRVLLNGNSILTRSCILFHDYDVVMVLKWMARGASVQNENTTTMTMDHGPSAQCVDERRNQAPNQSPNITTVCYGRQSYYR